MVTVDLAADAFCRRLGDAVEASWYTLHRTDEKRRRRQLRGTTLPFSYREIPDVLDEVFDHDAVLYWGDFLQARHYLTGDTYHRLRRRRRDLDDHGLQDVLHR